MQIQVRRLDPGLPLPAYSHAGDAGMDLLTSVDAELPPGGRAVLPTGIAVALPAGYAGFVHPRSGLAARLGITTLNAPGTVDAGYRGEIQVNLVNHDRQRTVQLRRGDRIAQLVVQRVELVEWVETEQLPASARGEAGHGSTGGHEQLPTAGQDG